MRKEFGLPLVVSFISILLCVSAVAGQASAKSGIPLKISGSVSAVEKHISRKIPPPKTAPKEAIEAEIEIKFPEFSCTTGSNEAVKAINQAVQSGLFKLWENSKANSVEGFLADFTGEYERSFKEGTDPIGAWSLKYETTISYGDEELVCLEITGSIFTGGAHPSSNISYLVFSMKSGEPIPLSSFVPREKMSLLTQVAEKHFRGARKLKPGETYEEAGFQFEKNRFALNENFLVSKAGLAFCFNQYELAPYSMGITELVIPWSDLKSLADAKGLAGRFFKTHP